MKKKLIRTATIAPSLDVLLKGQLSFLNNYFEVIAISGHDKYLDNVAQRENVRTISVNFERRISPINDLISLYKLFLVLRKEKPYIIHSITPKAGLLSMIAGFFARVPIRIHTFTGLIFPSKTGFLKIILILMDKVLCSFATHIIPEGNGVKNDLMAYRITNKPLDIIANGNVNGIDLNHFNPNHIEESKKQELRNELNILETDLVFLFVGRLVKDKGINELIAAFQEISSKNQSVKLMLVGPFEDDLDPILPITNQHITDNNKIILCGFQVDVRPYFSIANVFVFPSYREGFPNVVIQAGAMGLPCIVSNINGCNEIVTDFENGIIIKVKNQEAICKAMQLFLDKPELVKNLSINARQNIIAKFDQNIVWSGILKKYQSLETLI